MHWCGCRKTKGRANRWEVTCVRRAGMRAWKNCVIRCDYWPKWPPRVPAWRCAWHAFPHAWKTSWKRDRWYICGWGSCPWRTGSCCGGIRRKRGPSPWWSCGKCVTSRFIPTLYRASLRRYPRHRSTWILRGTVLRKGFPPPLYSNKNSWRKSSSIWNPLIVSTLPSFHRRRSLWQLFR